MYAELERKVCRICKKPKDKKEFRRISRGKETTQPDCKECRSYKEFVRGLKRNYGITPKQYEEMLIAHDNRCACCFTDAKAFKRRLHVDHDHTSGQVRALLCTRCNPLIGFAQEDLSRLEMAVTYLKKFKK